MARTLLLFPDAHAIARGKILPENPRDDLPVGFACGVFSKDVFGARQLFDQLVAPFGGGDITVRPEDGPACAFQPSSDFLFGAGTIAIGTVTDPGGRPHQLDFRRMLRDFVRDVPPVGAYQFGAELEFHLEPLSGGVTAPSDAQSYSFSGAAAVQACIEAMLTALDRTSLPWAQFSQESGRRQYEIALQHSEPLIQADRIFLARFVLRAVAARYGMRCTFVSVVDEAMPPSNLHLHVSDPGEPKSERFEDMCAGIASVVEEAFLALSPTVNARRAKPILSVQAKEVSIGHDDRFKALRIVGVDRQKRVEFRVPSSDANPYLVILIILAGIWRHRNKSRYIAADVRWGTAFEWDFARSIEAFVSSPIVRSVLSKETIELYSALKKGEAAETKGFDFPRPRVP